MKVLGIVLRLFELIGEYVKSKHRQLEQEEHQQSVTKAQEQPVEWFEEHFNGDDKPAKEKPDNQTGGR